MRSRPRVTLVESVAQVFYGKVRRTDREPLFAATAPPPEFRTSTGKPSPEAASVAAAKPGRRVSCLVAPT